MKKYLGILLSVAFAAFSAGCDILLNFNVVLMDDCIVWEPVLGADGYVVTVNGSEGPKVTETAFTLDKSVDVTVSVRAMSGDNVLTSAEVYRAADPVRSVAIDSPQDFYANLTQSEGGFALGGAAAYSLDFTGGLPAACITVPQNVRVVSVTTGGKPAVVSFEVSRRKEAIVFELNDAVLHGPDDCPVIRLADAQRVGEPVDPSPDLIFRLSGDNALKAGDNTVDGLPGADAAELGVGERGGDGNTGYDAVIAPVTLVNGTGSLYVYGGAGSAGGKGGKSSPACEGGYGGNGGDGGRAISGELLYVNLSLGIVSLTGGKGGAAGKQGAGFINITNMAQSGRPGRSFNGDRYVLGGRLEG